MNIPSEAARIIRGIVCGMKKHMFRFALASICCAAALVAADAAWKWAGSYGDKAVSMLIIGDIDIQLRADPTTAFTHIGETLKQADLVYANLEGMLVKPQGPEIDIPDKRGWRHPGPDGVKALTAWNVKVVGVANNVAYDRANILQTLKVLDANGIIHTGGGVNIAAAHKPAIVERKGVKIGFLQYTARWYQDNEQIATDTEPGVAKISSRDGITVDPADIERVRDDIRRLRSQVDIVVVSHHNRDGATATQFGTPPAARPSGERRDNHISEPYQKQFAHMALDAGADLVYGHGTHTVQGVEVYKGKPILYAIGHSAFDQPGYEKSKDGIVVHTVIDGKKIVHVSFVPVTRDAHNDVMMLDPSTGEGAALFGVIKGLSGSTPLKIDGQEVVLLDAHVHATHP
jgi:poly-gamma-glutamate capsule biosynthesis protein CapA/YwtB (metallophosphatase superfamily)